MTNTTNQQGYVQNAYAVLEDYKDDNDDLDDDVATVTTHLAVMTTQSQLTVASTAVNVTLVTTAINQLMANQMAMMQMMVYANTTRNNNQQRVRAIAGAPPVQYPPVIALPIVPFTQYNIPNSNQGGQGHGGRRQGGGRGGETYHILSRRWHWHPPLCAWPWNNWERKKHGPSILQHCEEV